MNDLTFDNVLFFMKTVTNCIGGFSDEKDVV